MEEKKKLSKGVEEFDGYGADPVPEQGQSLDWSDCLFLGNVYPQHPRNFKFGLKTHLPSGIFNSIKLDTC